MRAHAELTRQLRGIMAEMGLDWPDKARFETPKDTQFGDVAVNAAMLAAKQAGIAPRELAQRLGRKLLERSPEVQRAETAGPGFLNLTYADSFWQDTVDIVLRAGADYGRGAPKGQKVQVEFVSANPTGPLHIGHGRGAAVGDALTRLLRFAGYDAQSEYYINDAGKQMRLLGLSVFLRARELAGMPVDWPKDWYKGAYITDLAGELLEKEPGLLDRPKDIAIDTCFEYAQQHIMDGIKTDLEAFRVRHEVWFSERTLVADGSVDKAFDLLRQGGHIFEQDGACWFKTTALGDDRDRVLRKSDGAITYFASDIAYHANKFARGFDLVVDIWGADHHGYIPRMRAAVEALGRPAGAFAVILVQLVNLLENGRQIAMSTRQGQFETLADVIEEVGVDAARFMFLSRKSDSPLDFDLELVKQRSMDNPVYYVQYAYARIHALLRRAEERNYRPATNCPGELSRFLVHKSEIALLRKADAFPELAASAASALSPHHISFYLMELAGELHAYYAAVTVLGGKAEADVTLARLYMLKAVGQVLENGLRLLGVNAPERM